MAIRQSVQSSVKAKAVIDRPPQGLSKPNVPSGRKPGGVKATATTMVSSDYVAALEKQLEIQQNSLETQAWMVQEISDLRQQLAQKSTFESSDDIALRTEIETLRQENAVLTEKANRLNQMASLFNGAAVTAVAQPVTGSAPRGRKHGALGVTTGMNQPVPGFLWKAVAESDLNRTYKSCWPVVFKIEEWNQKNPTKMAKVSQTMLNKSGVNFSRAKGFVDTYAVELQQYHDRIGLTKANSGKFNEVYEFIRTSLGRGRRGYR
jgi:cell division protein FtsB